MNIHDQLESKNKIKTEFNSLNDEDKFEAFYLAVFKISIDQLLFEKVKLSMPAQSFSKIIKLFSEGKRIHDIRVYTPYLKELSDEYEVARNAFIAGDLEAVAKFFSRFSK